MVEAETQSSVQFMNHLKQNMAEGILVLDVPEMMAFTNAANAGEREEMSEALTYTQRLAGIGMLTAGIGHEMNTPLSIIAATCSNLQHEIEENNLSMEQLQKYVAMIEQNAWRAARIVEVLRNYSYDEETQTAVTDLNMIIEDALTLVQHQLHGEYNIQVETQLAQNLGTIVCDHSRLTQVLVNLLLNARDAIGRGGGKITIKSWPVPPPTVSLSRVNGLVATAPAREEYAFSVSDSGPGIDPVISEQIFEPFFSTWPNGKGAGLGLYVAKHIVEQHHGRITAENNRTGGATFTVVLPRQ
ncbi:MAG: hypothetical protein KJ069_04640 [Anaerolineae bacterium]|nr:hypothetical protein [Anaerolineae bacterium]